jgi:hypothetical protein
MRKRQVQRIATFAGLGAIAVVVAFMVSLQLENAKITAFAGSYESIAYDTNNLTQSYQSEVAKWKAKQYSNSTMIEIINNYLPKYQALIDRAQSLDAPQKYQNAKDFLIKSLRSEMQSNEHFGNYLATGNQSEYETSNQLLTDSFAYSIQADSAIREAQS